MKKFVFCAALFAAITFAACSDDDESNLPVTEANIVGTWQIVHAEGHDLIEGDEDTWSYDYPYTDEENDDEKGFYWTYTFDEGGTGTYMEYMEGSHPESVEFSYSISGNTLTIKGDPNDDDWDIDNIYQIKSLTKSQLVLFDYDDYHDDRLYDGEYFEETTTYKRIK